MNFSSSSNFSSNKVFQVFSWNSVKTYLKSIEDYGSIILLISCVDLSLHYLTYLLWDALRIAIQSIPRDRAIPVNFSENYELYWITDCCSANLLTDLSVKEFLMTSPTRNQNKLYFNHFKPRP